MLEYSLQPVVTSFISVALIMMMAQVGLNSSVVSVLPANLYQNCYNISFDSMEY